MTANCTKSIDLYMLYIHNKTDAVTLGNKAVCISDCLFFRETFIGAGGCYKEGDIITMPKLADTLELIAEKGASVFYTGPLADNIVADIQEQG